MGEGGYLNVERGGGGGGGGEGRQGQAEIGDAFQIGVVNTPYGL